MLERNTYDYNCWCNSVVHNHNHFLCNIIFSILKQMITYLFSLSVHKHNSKTNFKSNFATLLISQSRKNIPLLKNFVIHSWQWSFSQDLYAANFHRTCIIPKSFKFFQCADGFSYEKLVAAIWKILNISL